ncbi:NAD(P)-dependent oxidoreductase [Erwinia sp. MMLR14_017]|uniref:NAD(P)-dependent oxidoreductase n=1 Tax=Erwinia sp. MMLR14_017 TaxID=3093842 RepID=UPI00298F818A|nr:NAD(P)-dependent oxidoreductase [Erwinia sp. MMLR14_017]MDW8846184.1 NAD(P)-dependent oxidoreductase [Erwinia sp. MMLR14_017]
MTQRPSVAVLGLGAMGHAFAANLIKKGFTTSGWNRTKARGEDLISAGLKLADNPEEAVKEADVVIAMLADAETTETVLAKAQSALKQGAIVVQMGTIGVEATEKLIAAFQQQRPDVVFLDAPVSGTKTPAENAQIVILASGDRDRAADAETIFAAISKGTKWLGEAGKASRMKLVVNAWLISMVQGLSESTQMAKEFGFSPDDLWSVLEGGPLAVPYVKGKLEMIKEGTYDPQMHLTWALKDVNLALEAAKNSELPGLNLISDIWQQAVDAGYGEKDLSVVYRYLSEK